MTLTEIKNAVNNGKKVFWDNLSYQVVKDSKNQFLIKHTSGNCIGLTWADETTLNGKEKDFFIKH